MKRSEMSSSVIVFPQIRLSEAKEQADDFVSANSNEANAE